jgi:DNA-binding transcriptional regulator YdaS (Cro superfamily)
MNAHTPIPTRFEALRMVAAAFETQQAMADAFGVSQPTVWRWINQSKQLPAEYVLRAEQMTGVSRHALRPDIYPVEHAGSPTIWTALADSLGRVTHVNPPVSQRDTAASIRYRAGAAR